jgi:putative phosphoesterase
MKIALLSDTHGLLRPDVFPHLKGVDRILHAGDVGPVGILIELEAIAPVTAVWGNTDGFAVRELLPEVARLKIEGHNIVITHGHQFGYPTPELLAEDYPEAELILFGHTHIPIIERIEDQDGHEILAVNPGSCGARRSDLMPTLCLAEIEVAGITIELVQLSDQ